MRQLGEIVVDLASSGTISSQFLEVRRLEEEIDVGKLLRQLAPAAWSPCSR